MAEPLPAAVVAVARVRGKDAARDRCASSDGSRRRADETAIERRETKNERTKNNAARHAEEDHSSRDKEERRTDEKIDRRTDENERPTFSRREERTRADWKERPNIFLAISMERRPYE